MTVWQSNRTWCDQEIINLNCDLDNARLDSWKESQNGKSKSKILLDTVKNYVMTFLSEKEKSVDVHFFN